VAIPQGTLDRAPPPFFRQGPSAATKLAFFAALAVFLMVADRRFEMTDPLRAALATALLPLQRAAAVPVEMLVGGTAYLKGLQAARAEAAAAREAMAALSLEAARAGQLARENAELRALLGLRSAPLTRSVAAEVLYEAADPYSRKVVIDRGAAQGIVPGAPVVDPAGVLGQVTRVYTLTSEVTLLADKDAAIPVLNQRTMQRAAAFGGAPGGAMELRFTSANADVQPGDLLMTSGLDGVYPPGLPVARVSTVERRVESGFARILLEPAAAPDGVRHVLVLEPVGAQAPVTAASAAASAVEPSEPGRRRLAPQGPGR
jgi:rod shape-determining protein MreC